MPFTIIVNAVRPLAVVQNMLNNLERFKTVDMPGTLSIWQTDDMNRHKYPNVSVRGQAPEAEAPIGLLGGIRTRAMTKIWQHTHGPRSYMRKARRMGKPGQPVVKIKKVRAKHYKPRKKKYRRRAGPKPPILRPMLFEKLRERMKRQMQESLKWL